MVSIVEKVSEKVNIQEAAQLAEVAAEKTFSISIKVGIAAAIVIVGFILARLAAAAIRNQFGSIRGVDQTLVPILAQTVRYAIIFLTLIMALANFGIETTSFLAVLGAAGLAIGLALQGTLQNVAAGIMLLVIRPFKKGDYIESGSSQGTVDEIGLFMTRMHTVQGLFVAVPNSILWSNQIMNYSRMPRRRFDFRFGIGYDADIDLAQDVVLDLVRNDQRVHTHPEPIVVVRNLGDSSVDLELRAWTDTKTYWELNFDLTKNIKLELDKAQISIPYPHRQIVISPEVSGLLAGQNSSTSEVKTAPPKKTKNSRPKRKGRQAHLGESEEGGEG